MKVVRMNPFPKDGNSKLLAFFDVQSEEGIIIKGFKLVDGSNGKFISPPSEKGKDGKYYDSVILTKEMKEELGRIAIDDYNRQPL